jgi:hypothetical protein
LFAELIKVTLNWVKQKIKFKHALNLSFSWDKLFITYCKNFIVLFVFVFLFLNLMFYYWRYNLDFTLHQKNEKQWTKRLKSESSEKNFKKHKKWKHQHPNFLNIFLMIHHHNQPKYMNIIFIISNVNSLFVYCSWFSFYSSFYSSFHFSCLNKIILFWKNWLFRWLFFWLLCWIYLLLVEMTFIN